MPVSNKLKYLIIEITFCLILGAILTFIFCFLGNKIIPFFNNQIFPIILGALYTFLLTKIISSYKEYKRVSKLEMSLLTEVGFIARAVFYTLSDNRIKCSSLKETLSIKSAVMHSIGSDICLMDKTMAKSILEFHSLVKVVFNRIVDQQNDEQIAETIKVLAQFINKTKELRIAKEIILESKHASIGFNNYL